MSLWQPIQGINIALFNERERCSRSFYVSYVDYVLFVVCINYENHRRRNARVSSKYEN